MKRVLLILLALALCHGVFSQKVYFVYLQTDPAQPFYARIKDKVYSSAASGYLVLSKLIDSSYTITVGFPNNKWPEQQFTITVNTKDHGYLLKDFGEKGWGLFDLQTMNVIMSSKEPGKPGGTAKTDAGEVSDFTNILSKAADDPSLKEKVRMPESGEKKTTGTSPVETVKTESVAEVKKEPEKTPPVVVTQPPVAPTVTETVAEVKKEPEKTPPVIVTQPPVVKTVTDTVAVSTAPPVTTPKKEEYTQREPAKNEMIITPLESKPPPEEKPVTEEYKMSVVKKRSESSTTEGFGLVFTDINDGVYADTIRLLIPNPKQAVIPAVVKEEPKEEKKFLDITPAEKPVTAGKNPGEKVTGEKPVSVAPVAPVAKNCTAVADDNDFLKVRKRMAAGATDDNMITEARKYFKTKCFSTQQLKNLSVLFLTDESKYKFFDMAYGYTADPANFPSLQTELKEEYYINRFKAMLR